MNLVYMMPNEGNPEDSILNALQYIFYQLQYTTGPAVTHALTKAFGWTQAQLGEQQDLQVIILNNER